MHQPADRLIKAAELKPGMRVVCNDGELAPEVVKEVSAVQGCEMNTVCVRFTDGTEEYPVRTAQVLVAA